jgi:hypothetical protein
MLNNNNNANLIEEVFGLREQSTEGLIADGDVPEVIKIEITEDDINAKESAWK